MNKIEDLERELHYLRLADALSKESLIEFLEKLIQFLKEPR